MEQLLEQSLEGRGIQLLPVRGRCWRSSDGSAAAPDSGTAGTHLVDESIMHQLCGQILGVISCRDKEQENMNMDTACGDPVPGRAAAGAAHPGNMGQGGGTRFPSSQITAQDNASLGKVLFGSAGKAPGQCLQQSPQGAGEGAAPRHRSPAFCGDFVCEAALGLWLHGLQKLLMFWEGAGPAPFPGPLRGGSTFPLEKCRGHCQCWE